MKNIQLLDCTLRDGGHINHSEFGEDVIKSIIRDLASSGMDVIETGFLQNCEYDPDRAMYNTIEEAKRVLPKARPAHVKYALMAQADLYDFSKLEDNDGTFEIIRISFHDYHIEEGFAACEYVTRKGYKCFVNPINIMGYSDAQLLGFIKRANEIGVYGFTMVDTFGAMQRQDLVRIYNLIEHNLDKGIRIAVHLHENQSLSFSLAQNFIDISVSDRDITIDGSLYGMGRVPGNLCIELMMKYMNENCGASYDIEPVYDAIDEYIAEIKKRIPWGYSIAYALSAQHKVHRTYAEYLMGAGRLKTKQINQILSRIDNDHKTRFDREYADMLYAEYQSHSIDDTADKERLLQIISEKKDGAGITASPVLIIAPGLSIREHRQDIEDYIHLADPFVITANFIWKEYASHAAFFSNIRRWETYHDKSGADIKVITSNLLDAGYEYDLAVNYSDYAYYKDQISDNCILMLLRLLDSIGVKNVAFAGFDGFKSGPNFALSQMERNTDHTNDNRITVEVLNTLSQNMNFTWVTQSVFGS
ncbi:MAG: aldolase catalytic domain-containing protein [Lachnospiraceae bacterium]|nr:aldolase catalytic domain-containing protein [Lachnospiraceae bacterium]